MRNIIAFFVLMLALSCNQKEKEISLKLIPVQQGEYWGYVDKQGKFIINPQFKKAYTFVGDLALIQNTEGKYGFINNRGEYKIAAVYKEALSFEEGLAAVVKENQKIEYIDESGKTILQLDAKIEKARSFSDGLALVEAEGKRNYIDKTGKIVIVNQFDEAYDFSDGVALIRQKVRGEDKYGFIDKTGKIIITPQFEDANPFSEDRAVIKVGKKYGFIDKAGKIVIAPQFDHAGNFSQGLAGAKQGELWGFIDKDGIMVINPQFKIIHNFTNAKLCAVKSTANDSWGFIDMNGKMKIAAQFEYVTNFFDGISITGLNNKYGIVDMDGKYQTNPIYDDFMLGTTSIVTVESDFFDIANVSSPLFKGMNNTSFRGIQKNMSFLNLQAVFPQLTHENYSSFKGFEPEANNCLELTDINFLFKHDFAINQPKYKTESRYNYYTRNYEDYQVYDGESIVYNDSSTIRAVTFDFKLLNKARAKSDNILDELKNYFPPNDKMEKIDSNIVILDKTDYNLAIVRVKDMVRLVVAYDKYMFDHLRKK